MTNVPFCSHIIPELRIYWRYIFQKCGVEQCIIKVSYFNQANIKRGNFDLFYEFSLLYTSRSIKPGLDLSDEEIDLGEELQNRTDMAGMFRNPGLEGSVNYSLERRPAIILVSVWVIVFVNCSFTGSRTDWTCHPPLTAPLISKWEINLWPERRNSKNVTRILPEWGREQFRKVV